MLAQAIATAIIMVAIICFLFIALLKITSENVWILSVFKHVELSE